MTEILVYPEKITSIKNGVNLGTVLTGTWHYEVYHNGDFIGIGKSSSEHGARTAAGIKLNKFRRDT